MILKSSYEGSKYQRCSLAKGEFWSKNKGENRLKFKNISGMNREKGKGENKRSKIINEQIS